MSNIPSVLASIVLSTGSSISVREVVEVLLESLREALLGIVLSS
jgi:hypothetical protein